MTENPSLIGNERLGLAPSGQSETGAGAAVVSSGLGFVNVSPLTYTTQKTGFVRLSCDIFISNSTLNGTEVAQLLVNGVAHGVAAFTHAAATQQQEYGYDFEYQVVAGQTVTLQPQVRLVTGASLTAWGIALAQELLA